MDAGEGDQTYSNDYVKEWYSTNRETKLSESPEIVFCASTGGDPTKETECRRNGTTTANIGTGNPFRYSTAAWRTAYPEAPPVSEFWRASASTTVTVTTPRPHNIACDRQERRSPGL